MKKVKFDFKKQGNIKIDIDGNEVEIKPFVTTPDLVAINKLCCEMFGSDGDESAFPMLKFVFDLGVIEMCTNISLDGIKSKTQKGVTTLDLDVNSEKVENIENSGIIEKVIKHIANYEICFNQVMKAIEAKDLHNAINKIVEGIPDMNDLGDGFNEMVGKLKDIKETNPELYERAIKDVATKQAAQNMQINV